ncbi:S8 family serine peptidase [Bradyrhizobium sp. WSM 1704]|uniref:S8 family serine peptidase n=1 Tax=Bradyrhizobium semiaridum TaxID=2821404 RepID=UPI001CE281F8|nr:S8 family serine peptidase [Bradyrhizobium semiaridum]MCA6124867.1 S8 family serine peptidase [Bradyrhizobium semiaridum]
MAYEYKVMGQTVRLEVDPNTVAVRFQPTAPKSLRANAALTAGLSSFQDRTEIPDEGITLMPATGHTAAAPVSDRISNLTARPEVVRATPVFRLGDNRIVPSDRILVGFKDVGARDALVSKYGLSVIRNRDAEYLFKVPGDRDPLQLSREIAELPGVDYSEPDFITVGRHLPKFMPPQRRAAAVAPAAAAQDPLLPRQYAMTITGATAAWGLVQGSRDVRIAILDEGVQTTHPDLEPAVVGTYDGTDDDTHQEPNPWDGHGTSCAGLAAAIGNSIGVKGIGAGCSVLAVRIAYSRAPDSDWITTNEIIARSIDWSWKNGAWVLSNSWGGGVPSNAIAAAFERARTMGRDGKGCVVVIAAGNASGPVNFPATLPNVLAVSASNEFDEFKSKTSRDGEDFWGSCFGPQISIAAPGVHNYTIDIAGSAGYDPSDYTGTFNGTSSATPLVAGACALILSAAPNLREDQVRKLIVESADKVGAAPYVDGRNDFFGFGRLNVLRAIQAVQQVA